MIVTELDAKVGVEYEYQLDANSILSVDVGYLWLIYLNAITTDTDIGIVGTADGASIGVNTTANFSVSGWYAGITWKL